MLAGVFIRIFSKQILFLNKKNMEVEKMSDIEIIKNYYGLTTLQAKEYKKNVSKKTIELIKNSYENECKKTFYND